MKRFLALAALLAACRAQAAKMADRQVYTVTAYCHCAKCCGKAGQPTASGKRPLQGVTVAGPRGIPLGTRVNIEGLGVRIVQDRLAVPYDNRFDVFMTNHNDARHFGVRKLKVTILK